MAEEGETLRDTATRMWQSLEAMGWETTSTHMHQVMATISGPRDCIVHSNYELVLEVENEWPIGNAGKVDTPGAAEDEDGDDDEDGGEEAVLDDPYVEEEGVGEEGDDEEDDAQGEAVEHDGEALGAWYESTVTRGPTRLEDMWDPRDEV